MKRILCVAVAAFTLLFVPQVVPVGAGLIEGPIPAGMVPALFSAGRPVAFSFVTSAQAQPAAPATTQNTVTTTGPVSSTTTIETGTYAGQALMWVSTVFGGSVGLALTALIVRLLKNAGIQASETMRARLQEIIINGLNLAAKTTATEMAGRGRVDVKNVVVGEAVKYVQEHGADTLQQLGIDPNSNLAVDAIKARIETAIADPMQPTPAVLEPVAKPAPPSTTGL